MKNLNTAALLLLSISVLASQSSIAGKPDNPGGKPDKPDLVDCEFVEMDTACTANLLGASNTLYIYRPAFVSKKADDSYFGFRCKVADAEVKMSQNKPLDAFYSLEKAVAKVWKLFSQRKIDTYKNAEAIASSLEAAMSCADGVASGDVSGDVDIGW